MLDICFSILDKSPACHEVGASQTRDAIVPKVSLYRLNHVGRVYAAHEKALVPFEDILRRCGISPQLLEKSESKTDLIREAAVIEQVCEILGDASFAARAALSGQGSKTLTAYLVRSSETLGGALQLAQRYYTLEDTDMRFDLIMEDEQPVIVLGSRRFAAGQGARYREFLIFGLFTRARQIAGPNLGALTVEIESTDHTHSDALAEQAGCEVIGSAGRYALRLPKGAMNFRIDTADPVLLDYLRAQGEVRLSQSPETDHGISGKIVNILTECLPGRVPKGDEVAKQLGMTRRTMTRHLSSEGTSFKELLDSARCNMAKTLIKRGEGIAQIAFMLDFADQAAFSVAFKRWTGESPGSFRKAMR